MSPAFQLRRCAPRIARLALSVALLVLASCAPPAEPYPPEAPALEIHTDVDALYLEPLIRMFEVKHDVSVNVRYLPALDTNADGELDAKEVFDGKPPCDLVIARDAATLAAMGEALGPMSEDALARVPARFKDAARRWVGLYWQPAPGAHPKAPPAPPPATASELARSEPALEPRWMGPGDPELVAWVSCWLAGPDGDAVARAFESMAVPAGRVKRTHAHAQDALAALSRTTAGALVTSPAEHYRFVRLKPTDGAKLAMAVPSPERAAWSLAAVGVRANPAQPKFVADFLALALSAEGQAMVLTGDGNFVGNSALPVVDLADPAVVARVSPSIAPDVATGKIAPFPPDAASRFAHAARARALIKAATAAAPDK